MLPFELPYSNIQVFIFIGVFFVLLGLLGIGSIILRRMWQASHYQLLNRHKDLFVKWVISCVHADMVGQINFSRIYRKRLSVFVKGRYPRQILAHVFQQFMENLSGEYRQYLVQLYLDLNMEKYALRNAKSNNLEKNIHAIQEIRDFGLKVDESLILQLMQSKHKEVREEALYQLFDQHHSLLKHILKSGYEFNNWQKILVFNKFEKMSEDQMPDISECLADSSCATQVFLIDMIGRLQIKSYFIKLLSLLSTSTPKVQQSIITALIRFDRVEAIPFLEKLSIQTLDSKVYRLSIRAIRQIESTHPTYDILPVLPGFSLAS